jgi:hypothetical protein
MTTLTSTSTSGRDLIEALRRKRPEVAFAVTHKQGVWTVTATAIRSGGYVEGVAQGSGPGGQLDQDTVDVALKQLDEQLATQPVHQWRCDQ